MSNCGIAAKRIMLVVLLVSSISMMLLSTGCSYMQKRSNDAKDIFDIGLTVSPKAKPDFAVYIDFFGILPIGGSYMEETKLLGIGNRQAGLLDYENKSWGAVAWGSEKSGAGEFDPRDPYQANEAQQNLSERPRTHAGFVRLIAQGSEETNPPAFPRITCDKGVHIGYIGVLLNCRPMELFDFLAGWTTLDFMNDDEAAFREKE